MVPDALLHAIPQWDVSFPRHLYHLRDTLKLLDDIAGVKHVALLSALIARDVTDNQQAATASGKYVAIR